MAGAGKLSARESQEWLFSNIFREAHLKTNFSTLIMSINQILFFVSPTSCYLSLAYLFVALLTKVADALRPGLAEDGGPDAAKVQGVDHLRLFA